MRTFLNRNLPFRQLPLLFLALVVLLPATISGCISPAALPTDTMPSSASPLPSESARPTENGSTVSATVLPSATSSVLESTAAITSSTSSQITVAGYVVDGGDTSPKGLFDAPRVFVYDIEAEDGSVIHVSYTAYPPAPSIPGDLGTRELDFHAGTILIGDYLMARGTYEEETNTLIVEAEGDYIRTYPAKP